MEGEGATRQLYRYRFGTAEFDEARWQLSVKGVAIDVQRKPLEILAYFLSHCDEVVTKEQLLDALWISVTVENVLPNAVAKLRDALGDENAAHIVTIPRVGYRFDGLVERTAVGNAIQSAMDFEAGMPVPARKNFHLVKLIGRTRGGDVWTARHSKTGEVRVYKFGRDGERLSSLQREVMLSRVLKAGLGPREDIAWILDWNFETAPFFLECEFGGQNLIDWAAADDRLSGMALDDRLGIFLQILDAVSAAHGVGVLHKDLKPSNALVKAKGESWQVSLTDFGSGWLLEPDRLEAIAMSQPESLMAQTIGGSSMSGTPLYLAPELIAGQPATLRSDVYALGLILYQLVVGDFSRPLASGWERSVSNGLLRGDIASATDGDPSRRLDSAAELAHRLRTLENRQFEQEQRQAEQASAASAMEALKRSRARRPWAIATMAVLAIGLFVSLVLYFQVRAAEKSVADELNTSRILQQFLTDHLISAADPSTSGRSTVTVSEAVKNAASAIDGDFKSAAPRIRGELHLEMAKTFMNLSDYQSALAEGKSALAIFSAEQRPDPRYLADAQLTTVDILVPLSKLEEAGALLNAAEKTLRESGLAGSELEARFWMDKGIVAQGSLDFPQTLVATEKAWDLAQKIPNLTPDLRDRLEIELADDYRLSGDMKNAEAYFRDLMERQNIRYGGADVRSLFATIGLARVLNYDERYDEALQLLSVATPVIERSLGPNSSELIDAKSTLADIYFKQEKYDDAVKTYSAVATLQAAQAGDGSLHYLLTEIDIGMALRYQGKIPAAAQVFRQSLAKARTSFSSTDPLVQGLRYNLAASLLDLCTIEEVPALLDGLTPEALNLSQAEPDWDGRLAYQNGRLALQRGDLAAARDLLSKADQIITEKNPDGFITPDMIHALVRQASERTAKPPPNH